MTLVDLSEREIALLHELRQTEEHTLPQPAPEIEAPSGFATDFSDFDLDLDLVIGGFKAFELGFSSRKNKKKAQVPQSPDTECSPSTPMAFPWKTLILCAGIIVALLVISYANAPVVAHNASTGHTVKKVTILRSTSDSVVSGPTITASYIEHKLCPYNANLCGTGQVLYDLGVQYNVDPAFALAFFWHESNFGTQGMAVPDRSLGNLRCIDNELACNGGYAQFATWQDGYRAWFQLIASSLYVGDGLTTVSQIIPRYAPTADNNDEAAYIASVQGSVATYRVEGGHI